MVGFIIRLLRSESRLLGNSDSELNTPNLRAHVEMLESTEELSPFYRVAANVKDWAQNEASSRRMLVVSHTPSMQGKIS